MIFDRGQPVFVDTSERVKSSNDILPARDYLYKALMTEHLKIQEKLSDEKIETAYVELFKFHPSMRSFFTPFQVRSATVQHRQHGGVNGRGKGRGQGL
jgi:hypothetical protein